MDLQTVASGELEIFRLGIYLNAILSNGQGLYKPAHQVSSF